LKTMGSKGRSSATFQIPVDVDSSIQFQRRQLNSLALCNP